jgi:predicted  nucleic acid-binding Zn-ribbon protein
MTAFVRAFPYFFNLHPYITEVLSSIRSDKNDKTDIRDEFLDIHNLVENIQNEITNMSNEIQDVR